MASEQDKQELKSKVSGLVEAKFGGDYQRAFRHYDSNEVEKINKDEFRPLR